MRQRQAAGEVPAGRRSRRQHEEHLLLPRRVAETAVGQDVAGALALGKKLPVQGRHLTVLASCGETSGF